MSATMKRYFSTQIWPQTKALIEFLKIKGEGKYACEIIHQAVLEQAEKHVDDPESIADKIVETMDKSL